MSNEKPFGNHIKRPGYFYGYVVVLISFLMMSSAWIPYYAFGVFFTPVLTEFGWSRAVTSGAFSASQIMRGLFGVVAGRLNDKMGPRVVLTLSGLFLALGYLLMSQINSIWMLYVFFGFLIGMGMSGFWVPVLSTVARWFIKKRSTMTGIVLTATGVGTLVGAPVASRLISAFDWHTSYIILGVFILIVIPAGAQFLKREPAQMGQLPDGEKISVVQQKSAPAGRSLEEALRSREFWMYFLANVCFGYAIFTVTVHIVALGMDRGFSSVLAASVLGTVGAASLTGRLILGSLADRIGDKQIYIMGFITLAISFIWLMLTNQSWGLYLFAVIAGFAQGGMGAVGSPLLADLFGLKSHGLIFGVANVGHTMGAALGPFLSGYLFDLNGNYTEAIIVCSIISIVGLILTIFLRAPRAESVIS